MTDSELIGVMRPIPGNQRARAKGEVGEDEKDWMF